MASELARFRVSGTEFSQWRIDPFAFFRLALDTDELPKPDTTTQSGRRLYYSHIDGDGWRNQSEIDQYKEKGAYSSEVILEEIIRKYPDLPVTVGPVAADLHPGWYGTPRARDVARRLFLEPHVEAGSHTFSHPFDWGFFQNGDHVQREHGFLELYPPRLNTVQGRMTSLLAGGGKETPAVDAVQWDKALEALKGRDDADWRLRRAGESGQVHLKRYERPRAYAVEPFDLDLEIGGSVQVISSLLPRGKSVRLFQWSGSTVTFEEAITRTRKVGLRNLNGGDTRFDREYPSLSWVAPIGRYEH
ncbi:MAG: hypothetical protein H7831_02765, partial [Magnetococcus sp. WYHC-3]